MSSVRSRGVLASLLEQGAVRLQRAPRANLFTLDRGHVLAEQVLPLFEREERSLDELVGLLREELGRHARFASAAWLFGSIVWGDMEPASDVDLAVVCPRRRIDELEEATLPVETSVRRRFGNRLSVLPGVEPMEGLVARGRPGSRLWRRILEEGLPVLGEVPSR
jgi:predicted nucleotidyltransferase